MHTNYTSSWKIYITFFEDNKYCVSPILSSDTTTYHFTKQDKKEQNILQCKGVSSVKVFWTSYERDLVSIWREIPKLNCFYHYGDDGITCPHSNKFNSTEKKLGIWLLLKIIYYSRLFRVTDEQYISVSHYIKSIV